MKTIKWNIGLSDIDNKLISVEELTELSNDNLEHQLLIIGILENIKQRHLDKIKSLYEKTVK